jgi:hypothetical protein
VPLAEFFESPTRSSVVDEVTTPPLLVRMYSISDSTRV